MAAAVPHGRHHFVRAPCMLGLGASSNPSMCRARTFRPVCNGPQIAFLRQEHTPQWSYISFARKQHWRRNAESVGQAKELMLTEWSAWYTSAFKDPMMADPPVWFRSFIYSEAFFQLPFFPVATYAFWKGNCKWIRTPAIIYATHVATTLLPILAHILFSDFSKSQHPGPQTHRERLTLVAIYIPYLLIPLLILVSMLLSPSYNQVEKRKKK